jgi:hypothetical protein
MSESLSCFLGSESVAERLPATANVAQHVKSWHPVVQSLTQRPSISIFFFHSPPPLQPRGRFPPAGLPNSPIPFPSKQSSPSSMAQRKRAGLITRRSLDRNQVLLWFFFLPSLLFPALHPLWTENFLTALVATQDSQHEQIVLVVYRQGSGIPKVPAPGTGGLLLSAAQRRGKSEITIVHFYWRLAEPPPPPQKSSHCHCSRFIKPSTS